jgi:hypothetical protein
MCRADRAERNPPPSRRVGDAHHQHPTALFQPPCPHSWGMEETQRGSAPLHAPMDGTGESKLVRKAWTLLDPRHPPVANRNSYDFVPGISSLLLWDSLLLPTPTEDRFTGRAGHCQAIPDRQTTWPTTILLPDSSGEHRRFIDCPAGIPHDLTDTIGLARRCTSFGRRKPNEHKETGADHRQ